MEKRLNWDDFKDQFHESWHVKIKPAIESEWMFDIYAKLKQDAQKEIIVPNSDSVFTVFKETKFEDVKSIWYLMDPYPRRYKDKTPQATGVAMDCRNSPDGKIQPSLDIFYGGISADLDKRVTYSPSLSYLGEQGVMLLNTDLTCKLNKTTSHEKLWEPFQKYFLEEVMGRKTGVIYVLAGKSSVRMEKYIFPPGNYIFKLEHPVAASHKGTIWDHQGIFTKTNQILQENNDEYIFWNKYDWESIKESDK